MMTESEKHDALPSPVAAANFIVAAAVNQVLLTYGGNRVAFNAAGEPTMMIEWLGSLAMSPMTAKALSENLAKTIAAYESAHGVLPAVKE